MRLFRLRSGVLLAALGLPGALLSCAKKQEVVVQTAANQELTASDIDRDPLALLPGGAIGLFHIEAQKLFASELGQKILAIARRRSPIPASAEFDPGRDVERVFVGSYSMQGVDVAAVVIGKFDREKIEKAAAETRQTPLGVPIVESTYAGRKLYTAQNAGFVVLTNRTVLAGNETGIRRALDRIKEGRVTRQVPKWMEKLLENPNASIVGGADFRAQPVSDAVRAQLPFVAGLDAVQFLGNFEPPGLNFAGTLSYTDEQAAQVGADNLRRTNQQLQNYGFLMTILGISQPVRKLEVEPKGKDAKFVVALDGQAISRLLDKAEHFLGTPVESQPVPARQSPAIAP